MTLHGRGIARLVVAALVAIGFLALQSFAPATAAAEDRTLYLHHTHTGETGRFTFKRNGVYDQAVLRQMNEFLADWRNHKQTNMDPALFDLLWLVYQEVGASQPINIVSSYRSPETNAMLRARSSGVAENSQHMRGKAMDFFIPGVQLSRLREVAMKYQVGGVGYYPTSGSPFVHLDTGSVRAWPRMTTAQLKKVFPDGRTLHLPADGRPLSQSGRQYAEAEWNKCHMVPCSALSSSPTTMLAGLGGDAPIPATPGKSLLDLIFGNNADPAQPQQPPADMAVAALEPTQRVVETIDINAPMPMPRRDIGAAEAEMNPFTNGSEPLDPSIPFPATKSPAILLATGPSQSLNGQTALMALADLGAPTPEPRAGLPAKPGEPMVTAYAPAIVPDPDAQRALQMIIQQETTGSLPPPKPLEIPAAIADTQIAAIAPVQPSAMQGLFDTTWDAVASGTDQPVAQALLARTAPLPNASFVARDSELTAPDIDHVTDVLVMPVMVSSAAYAEVYEQEGYLDPETELGPLATRVGFMPESELPVWDRFDPAAPLVVR